MERFINWHKNYYYGLLEKWNVSSYQAAWLSWFKGFIIGFIIMTLCSCSTYQLAPIDKCCETEVVYLDEIKGDSVNIFTSLDFNTITFKFKPRFYRGSNLYWGNNYGYWGSRPLWMDFNFYNGNFYSYHNPYYSYFNRPWSFWDYYMRPWTPSNNWYQGPFNNQGYNVVYNSGRRGSLTESNRMSIKDKIGQASMIESTKPRVNIKPVVNNKPIRNNTIINNNNSRPVIRNNNSRPSYNNSKPVINNSRPSFNSKPSFNSNTRPNNTKPSTSTKRGGKNN